MFKFEVNKSNDIFTTAVLRVEIDIIRFNIKTISYYKFSKFDTDWLNY